MEQAKLKANLREEKGKQAAKRLRRQGLVPAVVYRRGQDPLAVCVADKELARIIHASGGGNVLVDLTIDKDKKEEPKHGERAKPARPRPVIIKEIQQDPVKRQILHVDFNEISLTEKIIVDVELVAVGEPIGVQQEGGILEHALRQLKVQCLPADIPKQVQADVSGLRLNATMTLKDLALPENVEVLHSPETLLFQVRLPVEEKAEEPSAQAPEVEVIREKKVEEPSAPEKAKEDAKSKEAPKAEKK